LSRAKFINDGPRKQRKIWQPSPRTGNPSAAEEDDLAFVACQKEVVRQIWPISEEAQARPPWSPRVAVSLIYPFGKTSESITGLPLPDAARRITLEKTRDRRL